VEDVTEHSKTLPGAVFATRNPYTCAVGGIQDIKQAILEHNLTPAGAGPAQVVIRYLERIESAGDLHLFMGASLYSPPVRRQEQECPL